MLDADLVPAAWRARQRRPRRAARPRRRRSPSPPPSLLLAAALWWATGRIAAPRAAAAAAPPSPPLAAAAVALAAIDAAAPLDPPGDADTARLAWEHLRDGRRARADLAALPRRGRRATAYAALPPAAILPALRGTDVLVIFVESYGRSALENPLYAPTVTAALARRARPRSPPPASPCARAS